MGFLYLFNVGSDCVNTGFVSEAGREVGGPSGRGSGQWTQWRLSQPCLAGAHEYVQIVLL